MNKLTLLKTTFAENYNRSQGCTVDIDYIINQINEDKLNNRYREKNKNACFTITDIGYRIAKDDTDFFKHWSGYIFVDLDKVTHIKYEIQKLHKAFCDKPYYKCCQMSSSGNGLHFFFYIPPKYRTKLEYYTCVGLVYNVVKKYYKNEIDVHNVNHSQVFKLSPLHFLTNPNFDEAKTEKELEQVRYDDDETFYNAVKHYETVETIVQQNCFKHETVQVADIKADFPIEVKLYEQPKIVWDHNNRFLLFNTLCYFYDVEDARNLCVQVSMLNRKSDTEPTKIIEQAKLYERNDKYGCNRRICEELVNVYHFDIYTTEDVDDKPDLEIFIGKEQYLSDVFQQVLDNLANVTLLELCAGGGKTTAIREMTNNVILTEPMTSIIKGKIETDVKNNFLCVYDDIFLDNKEEKICCTPDKLINFDDTLLENIKYVFVDESHTIFTHHTFRLNTMSKFVEKLKSLAKQGKKIVLMTGTPIKEKALFEEFDCKHIRISREPKHSKNITFQYVNNKDTMKQHSLNLIDKCLKSGCKIAIPCNKGNGYVEDFVNLLKGKYRNLNEVQYTYFKKDKVKEQKNNEILASGMLNDVDILFSTLYMGEGIDINYTGKVKLIIFDVDLAQSIEQYCARFRNIDIDAIVYLNRENSKYNLSYPYALKHIDEDELKNVEDLLFIYNRNKTKWQKDIDLLLSKYPYFDKDTGQIDKQCLSLFELANSAALFFKQLTVVSKMLQKYGFNVKFKKTIDDDTQANEINNILLNSRKHRKFKEYEKAIELIDEISEDKLNQMKVSYKTKEKIIHFISKLYNNGVKFDDCKKIAKSICHDNKVYWSEMKHIVMFTEYLFEDKVNGRISENYQKFVNELKEWCEGHKDCNIKIWQQYKDRCVKQYCKLYNITNENVQQNVKAMIDNVIQVHIKSKQQHNCMNFDVVDYGQILDNYYLT